jgi:hypothetical protein
MPGELPIAHRRHIDGCLAARGDCHVAADEKGQAAEHLLLAQISLVGDQVAYAIREVLVVGHGNGS